MIEVVVQLVTTGGLIVIALIGRKKLDAIAGDAKEARDQTANTHKSNLRDDIDGLRDDVTGLKDTLGVVHGDLRGLQKDVTGLRSADGTIRKQLALAVQDREHALEQLRAEIPGRIAREIRARCQPPHP